MTKPRPAGRVRILNGLVIAALALLAVKAVALLRVPEELGPDGLPSFARVLAHARTNYVPADPTTTGSLPASTPPKPAASPDPPVASAPREPPPSPAESPSEKLLRERLSERRDQLRDRTRELDQREKVVEEMERRLDVREADQKTAEERRQEASASGGGLPESEAMILKGVVIMYEAMKPKEAARIFDRLPQDVLVPVVRRINPRKMAEILAAMAPEMAEKLTVALARRDRTAGDERAAAGYLPPGELPAIEPERRPVRRIPAGAPPGAGGQPGG